MESKPTSYKEAKNIAVWRQAMQNYYDSLLKNGTCELVDPPLGYKPIGYKHIFRNKYKTDGSLEKHKLQFVAKDYAQKECINYDETFAPTTKWTTIQSTSLFNCIKLINLLSHAFGERIEKPFPWDHCLILIFLNKHFLPLNRIFIKTRSSFFKHTIHFIFQFCYIGFKIFCTFRLA